MEYKKYSRGDFMETKEIAIIVIVVIIILAIVGFLFV